jgi:cytosine/adenosine deaminase-related metal-dependent hydrolase
MELFAASYLLDATARPMAGGAIAVADGRIVDTGSLKELRERHHGAAVSEFPGSLLMPGLVNAHSHLELTHFSSWKMRKGIDYSPRTYVDWIIQVIKIRRGLTRDELEQSVREGIRIALVGGTTTLGEIVSDRSLIPLYRSSPFAGRLYLEMLGHDPSRCAALLADVEEFLAHDDIVPLLPGISPHSPHTLSARFLQESHALARRYRLPLAMHLSESREEQAFMHDSSGGIAELLYPFADWNQYLPPPRRTTSTAYLDELGVLGPETTVVHGVHLTPSDVEILRQRGCTVVLCPRSNDRLDVGKAPVQLLKSKGIPLALGTDSLASNDSLSSWDEMRFMRREFPGVFTPEELLQMATLGGARALGCTDEVGSLDKGKRADFLVMRLPAGSNPGEFAEALIEEGHLEEVCIGGNRIL